MADELTADDVKRYWSDKCGQRTCRVCGSSEPPMVAGTGAAFSRHGAIVDTEAGPTPVSIVSLVCPDCGLATDLVAERIIHWKTTGE